MQQSFSDLGVCARIVRTLAERDIHTPFPIQAQVLRDALAGRDVLAKAPTGSGKTLAFAIPIVERIVAGDERPAAVVLVPTRELASQVAGELEAIAPAGIDVATVYGGVPIHAQAKRARTAHVLVATPGRLNDLLERKAITLDGVKIDEEAIKAYERAIEAEPDHIFAQVQLALLYAQRERYDQATETLQRAAGNTATSATVASVERSSRAARANRSSAR